MSRGLPFVVTGIAFLSVAAGTYVTGGSSTAVVWFSVGIAMLAVGAGLSQRDGDEPEPDDAKRV